MTELRYIRWSRFLWDTFTGQGVRNGSLQWACSEGLRKQNIMAIQLDKIDKLILEYRGCRFYADCPNYFHIFTIYDDYAFDLIRKDDTILDLGANIGAFAIPASKLCKKMYAVEPVTLEELENNRELNGIRNITILPYGVGSGIQHFNFLSRERNAQCKTLSELRYDKKISFVKMDIEGDEWIINPKEFRDVRVVTGEVHLTRNNKWKEWLDWFRQNNYRVEVKGSWKKEKRFTAEWQS